MDGARGRQRGGGGRHGGRQGRRQGGRARVRRQCVCLYGVNCCDGKNATQVDGNNNNNKPDEVTTA